MKKRVLAAIIAGVFVLGTLAGCGGKKEEAPAASGTEEAAPAGEEKSPEAESPEAEVESGDVGKITMIMALRDEFLSTLESGAKEIAVELGVELNTVDAQSDASKMIQFIETARNNGEKAIIINMVDPETAAQCVEAAGDMKVVFVNRFPSDDSVLGDNVVYVGSDENVAGKLQGDWLVEKFKAEGKTDVKYILLQGTLGQTNTTLRSESVLKALEDGGINATEATAPLAADFDRAKAQDLISPLLNTIEYDCIIANNDSMALGATEAMKQGGLNPSDVPIVGIDATIDGVAAVESGEMGMTVFQDAAGQGRGALIAAINLVTGAELNNGSPFSVDETGLILWVPFEPVTQENVADYK